jgi:EpsI family protein
LPERWLALAPLVLAAQGICIHWVAGREHAPEIAPFSAFPARIGTWQETQEQALEPEVAHELSADALLNRTYTNGAAPYAANLLIAWFASQRNGAQPHSPKVCLPGSGWLTEWSGKIEIPTSSGPILVNELLAAYGKERSVILYWYQNPRRVVAGELSAKLWTVYDAIRYRRTDLALVRVAVSRRGSDDEATSQAAALAGAAFIQLRNSF